MGHDVIRARQGETLMFRGRPMEVAAVITETGMVLLRSAETGEHFETSLDELAPMANPLPGASRRNRRGDPATDTDVDGNFSGDDELPEPYIVEGDGIDVAAVDEKDWEIANKRHRAIEHLLDDERPTQTQFAEAGAAHGFSASSTRRWFYAYRKARDLIVLLPKKPGPNLGTVKLSPPVDFIVRESLKEYLSEKRLPAPAIFERIEARCRAQKLPVPARSTIQRRIDRLPKAAVLRARGLPDEAEKLYAPALGGKIASSPMSLVQIDHTLADIILVDSVSRKPLGRPWTTLSIDVFSRMPTGLYVAFEKPDAAAVGLCLQNTIFEKTEYLRRLGIEEDYPVHGQIGTVHADNALEFRSHVMERGCARHNIDIRFRPVKQPKYGGHIERLMGHLAKETAKMPGKVLNDIRKRRGLKPESEAALTLQEFEACMAEYFFFIYPEKHHTGIHTTPSYMWHSGINGEGEAFAPRIPYTEEQKRQIAIDLLPCEERTVQHYGVQVDYLNYYSPVLNPLIRGNAVLPRDRKKKYIVRYDPRDMSQVLFFDHHAGQHHWIPLARPNTPAFSRWEWNKVRAEMKQRGEDTRNERLFFAAMARFRDRIAESERATAAAKVGRRINENALNAERARAENRARIPTGFDASPAADAVVPLRAASGGASRNTYFGDD